MKITQSRTIQLRQYEPHVVTIEEEGDDADKILEHQDAILEARVKKMEDVKAQLLGLKKEKENS